jgi:hypothetical protein
MGPVYRPGPDDNDEGEPMPTTTETDHLTARWQYLRDGATLGAMLTHLARRGSMPEVAAAIGQLDREQLEAAAFAMVLIHADNAPMIDPETTPNG